MSFPPNGPQRQPSHLTTFEAWSRLIAATTNNISIASSYWTLRSNDVYQDNSSWQGQAIFDALFHAGAIRGIKLRIVQNVAPVSPDTLILSQSANADVRKVDFTKYFGHGILHTKLWIFDDTHFYLGSANMDWRSLTQVKEIGLLAENCSCLASDVAKIFQAYWYLGGPTSPGVPVPWPESFATTINVSHPLLIKSGSVPTLPNTPTPESNSVPMDGSSDDTSYYRTYVTSSPAQLCAPGRTNDIDGILDVINSSKKYIYISVMEYIPGTLYLPRFQYWSVIDDALRTAALSRRVQVRLLISWWKHSNPNIFPFLRSLTAISGAEGADLRVKIMVIPATDDDQKRIPYSRVNHDKYMVTERAAYIGTSNWSADYFRWTGGTGIILKPGSEGRSGTRASYIDGYGRDRTPKGDEVPDIRQQLEDIFLRDWDSAYATELSNFTIPRLTRHSRTFK